MKKINLLVALALNLNAFSQELKKTTTPKEIKKSEKVKADTTTTSQYFDYHVEYTIGAPLNYFY